MTASPPLSVRVDLAARSYDIVIGPDLIESAGERIAALRPRGICAVVTDETVAKIHLPTLRGSLDAAGVRNTTIIVPPGEGSKSFATLETVVDALLAARIDRSGVLIALGGGVVGDLTGFVAATVLRGLDVVQIPTTLLSQVDSSVGGKTGINTRHGKNLVGAFHQPLLVLADMGILDTLPSRQFRAGYAEVAKYGLIDNAPFFGWLEDNWRGVFAGDAPRMHAIETSCRAKAAIVARDEKETGDRALLNLGHTFGHALEKATGFSDRLLHGEGVSIGMVLAFDFSASLGLCDPQQAARVAHHLAATGLPTRLSEIPGDIGDVEALMAAIAQDKKVSRGGLTFILARAIGQSFIARDVPADKVRTFLESRLAER